MNEKTSTTAGRLLPFDRPEGEPRNEAERQPEAEKFEHDERPAAEEYEPEQEAADGEPEVRSNRRAWTTAMIAGGAVSVLWLILGFIYVTFNVGWASLWYLGPQDLGASLAGLLAFPIAVWLFIFIVLVIFSLDRSQEVQEDIRTLRAQMDELAYPPEGHEGRTKSLADNLREQASVLREAGEHTSERLAQTVQAVATHTSELSNVSGEATKQAMQVMNSLQRQAESLERLSSLLSTRLHTIEAAVRRQADSLSTASGHALSQSKTISEALAKQIEELTAVTDRTAEGVKSIREAFRQIGRAHV